MERVTLGIDPDHDFALSGRVEIQVGRGDGPTGRCRPSQHRPTEAVTDQSVGSELFGRHDRVRGTQLGFSGGQE